MWIQTYKTGKDVCQFGEWEGDLIGGVLTMVCLA